VSDELEKDRDRDRDRDQVQPKRLRPTPVVEWGPASRQVAISDDIRPDDN
jgi:hypothetical protein